MTGIDDVRILLELGKPGDFGDGLIWYKDGYPAYVVHLQARTVTGEWQDVDIVIIDKGAPHD